MWRMEPNTWKSFIIDDTRKCLLGIICEDICYKNLIEVVLEEVTSSFNKLQENE